MGWDALHLSPLNGGSEVAIKGSETWLCSSSPFFFFFLLIFNFVYLKPLSQPSVVWNGTNNLKSFVFIKNVNECFF